MNMTKRSWKIIGIVAGIIAILLIALAIALPIFIDPNRYHNRIVAEIQATVGGKVRLGHLTWGLSNGLWAEADGLDISGARTFLGSARFSRVYVKVSVTPLMAGKIVLSDVILEGPEASLMLAPPGRRESPAGDRGPPDQVPSAVPSKPPIAKLTYLAVILDRVEVTDTMTVPGQKVKRVLKSVRFEAKNLAPGSTVEFLTAFQDADPRGLGQVSATGSLSGLSAGLTFDNPELQLNAEIAALHVDALKPYFPKNPMTKRLGGDISVSATYDGNLISRHRIDGRIDLARFSYTDPKRLEAPISGADTVVTFRTTINPQKFSVDKLTIQRGPLSAIASGSLEPWYRKPVLKGTRISANLTFLPKVLPLIPWKQLGPGAEPFKKAMGRGGNITIQEAVIADIELAKPPTTAAEWLAKIDATATAAGVSLQPSPKFPMLEDISTRITLKNGNATFTESRGRIGPNIKLSGEGSILNIGCDRPTLKKAEVRTDFQLAALAPLIPWKQFGADGAMVRQVLESGGSAVIERAVVRDVDLSDPPSKFSEFLPRLELAAKVSGVSMRPSGRMPGIEAFSGNVNLRKTALSVSEARGRVGPVSLPRMNITARDIVSKPKLILNAKGPMRIGDTRQKSVEKLLNHYGLKSLSGRADIDLTLTVDFGNLSEWRASGALELEDVRAVTYPTAVVLEDLKGQVGLSRKRFTTVSLKNLTASVNRAPVRITGEFSKLGAPDAVIDAKAYTSNLDLTNLRELNPALKETGLSGHVTMDLDMYIPYGDPTKSRLSGALTAQKVSLNTRNYTVQQTDAKIDLAGNTATVKHLTGKLNDQPLSMTGSIVNPAAPDIKLAVTSPNLNLDRLVPKSLSGESAPGSKSEKGKPTKKQSALPPIAKNTTAEVTITANKGRYRGMSFQNLSLKALFDRGVIKKYDLQFGSGQGRVALSGSADFRKPTQIPFSVTPNVSGIPVNTLMDVIGMPASVVTGPVFLKGQLSGRSGTQKELLASLEGNLDAQMGPGVFRRIGQSGELMAKILSLTSVQGLLSGSLFRDFDKKGMSYQTLTTQTVFSKGILDVKSLQLKGDTMNMAGRGRIDMVNEQLDLAVNLGTLGLVGEVLKAIPLFGQPMDSLTEIHVDIQGSFEKPDIKMGLVKQP